MNQFYLGSLQGSRERVLVPEAKDLFRSFSQSLSSIGYHARRPSTRGLGDEPKERDSSRYRLRGSLHSLELQDQCRSYHSYKRHGSSLKMKVRALAVFAQSFTKLNTAVVQFLQLQYINLFSINVQKIVVCKRRHFELVYLMEP